MATLSGYLVVKNSRARWALSGRFVTKAPALAADEISIKIECEIPTEMFTRPQLKFVMNIPKDAVPQKEITAEVQGNIQDLIQQNLGITVTLVSETQTEES